MHYLFKISELQDIKTFDQPTIAIVGYPAVFVLSIAGQNINFRDLSEGLKSFFAYHFTFNIRYLKKNNITWIFIQKYIFGITSTFDGGQSNETLARDLGLL